ncbi:MAG: NAD(P)-dependent oxidoreductase [Candidatus Tectomicrobia bacterium]|uniref:NAD(P)-dependent oxidoreductase n=1 Tax=Tectimicrobiota bacterium TaxID=2528274 RepID=A0A932LZ95_UNCTE|nr:NAD(P)-dependent oxidoreductase [Candidatus Tectomicrobia bacterium]
MRILVTGGNGSVGRELVPALLFRGHNVVVLDKDLQAFRGLDHPVLELVPGGVEEAAAVAEAARGVEAIIHLAWSFSEDPRVLLEQDLRGHLLLLEAARSQEIRHFIYTSTAVVYGKPFRIPIDEDHPLRVLEARKPAYGVAKEFAEKLTLLAAKTHNIPATILRFWWAFGEEIGGRHLREMLQTAASGQPLMVPADCGGSFLSMEDFNRAVELILLNPAGFGEIFNLASAYVTWEEIARMATEVTGSSAGVMVVPPPDWTGAAFLADQWKLDDRRIRERLGFKPSRGPVEVRQALRNAIAKTWQHSMARGT